jgi:hypothetical protein
LNPFYRRFDRVTVGLLLGGLALGAVGCVLGAVMPYHHPVAVTISVLWWGIYIGCFGASIGALFGLFTNRNPAPSFQGSDGAGKPGVQVGNCLGDASGSNEELRREVDRRLQQGGTRNSAAALARGRAVLPAATSAAGGEGSVANPQASPSLRACFLSPDGSVGSSRLLARVCCDEVVVEEPFATGPD